MDVAITGAGGTVGSALVADLRRGGHRAVPLVRREPVPGADEIRWDPAAGTIDAASLEGFDAVVHLAGEGIGERRWSEEQKRRIRDSRVLGTTLLSETLAGLQRPPTVLISASAIDVYGDRGDEVLTEESTTGDTWLADVCRAWEGATAAAVDAGIRVTTIRTAMVLEPGAGAMGRMLPIFRLGLGGRLGSGRQWWSWIALDDEVGAIRFLLVHDIAGPVNLSSPQPLTNAEFSRTLRRALRRPPAPPAPKIAPQLLYGRELVDALLYGSKRVVPAKLTDAGFRFAHPELAGALAAMLAR